MIYERISKPHFVTISKKKEKEINVYKLIVKVNKVQGGLFDLIIIKGIYIVILFPSCVLLNGSDVHRQSNLNLNSAI